MQALSGYGPSYICCCSPSELPHSSPSFPPSIPFNFSHRKEKWQIICWVGIMHFHRGREWRGGGGGGVYMLPGMHACMPPLPPAMHFIIPFFFFFFFRFADFSLFDWFHTVPYLREKPWKYKNCYENWIFNRTKMDFWASLCWMHPPYRLEIKGLDPSIFCTRFGDQDDELFPVFSVEATPIHFRKSRRTWNFDWGNKFCQKARIYDASTEKSFFVIISASKFICLGFAFYVLGHRTCEREM